MTCRSRRVTSTCSTTSRWRSTAASTSRSSARTAPGRRRCSRRSSAGGRRAIRLGHGVVPAYFSQHEAELDERGTVLECVQAMTGLRRPEAQNLLGRFLFSGWETHEKAVRVLSGGERRRLALAVVVASGRELPRPRRADEPPRPREPRGARGCAGELPGHGPAGLARPRPARRGRRANARDRGRDDPELRRRLGRLRRERAARGRNVPPPADMRPLRPKFALRHESCAKSARNRKAPRELEQVETAIQRQEETVAELERKLADDGWDDMDLLTAHRAARDRAPVAARSVGDALRAGAGVGGPHRD